MRGSAQEGVAPAESAARRAWLSAYGMASRWSTAPRSTAAAVCAHPAERGEFGAGGSRRRKV